MPEAIFDRVLRESAGSAEHVMLIGLGEPLLDRAIFDRVAACARHGISTLLSTNGMLLDEALAARLLDSPLDHITLSMDGTRKETYEHYRKGSQFERVRDNFVRFARMKHERRSHMQVVVQMVRLPRNADQADEFVRFWRAVPGVDQVRVKADETNVLQPDVAHVAKNWKHPCHYLWRGPLFIKYNGDVYPCCQSYMLGGAPAGRVGERSLGEIWNGPTMTAMRRLHAARRAGEIDACARCLSAIPHPVLVAGSLLLHGRWVRRLLPWAERLFYRRPSGREK
jgi:radical SAM protein with 4Fe4S-binding SPASM domain